MHYHNKSTKQGNFLNESDSSDVPSNNLWVGNLTIEVTDSDLMVLFSRFGTLDRINAYTSKSYAFIYFMRVDDAKLAKESLHGTFVRGNKIKIEFAKPAKPSRSLWVGGIGLSVTKEILEGQFLKFGKIEDFKFSGDHNTAFIDFYRLEDALEAMKIMNGKRLCGDQIRVDFVRSQPPRRGQSITLQDARDDHLYNRNTGFTDSLWTSRDIGRDYSESTHLGSKRHQPSQSSGGKKGDGPPSNVLWIGYPPSSKIDERMLHNAMILFGEIERIKCFPSRNYSFVEFRSVEEARCAKEGLEGRLFNNPQISIMFSSSGFAPGKDYPGFLHGTKDGRPDMCVNDLSLKPELIHSFSENCPTISRSFNEPLPPSDNKLSRPFSPLGGFDRSLPGSKFSDFAIPESRLGPNWRRPSSSSPGILHNPTNIRSMVRSMPTPWDVLDGHHVKKVTKRSRMDGEFSIDDTYPMRKRDSQGHVLDRSYAFDPQFDVSGPSANPHGNDRLRLNDSRISTGGSVRCHPDNDYVWRGVIAKGGTHVCHARCYLMGKSIGTDLSEVVNCSARTGLDTLSKHYDEALGFDIVFFLPNSEDDFAAYLEFIGYLGSKNWAGVAKLDDGTTLFLVPPSDFLTDVLKVSGPDRLYGVVLKLPQYDINSPSMQQHTHHSTFSSQYGGRQHIDPSQPEYNVVSQKDERALYLDCGRDLPVESKVLPKPLLQKTTETHMVPQDYVSSNNDPVHQSGLTLTPELIATLATLLPLNAQSSASSQPPPLFATTATNDTGHMSQGWKHEYEAPVQTGHHQASQPLKSQFNSQSQHLLQYQTYPTITSALGQASLYTLGSTQIQDHAVSLPQSAPIFSQPLAPNIITTQARQFHVPSQAIHQHQLENLYNSQMKFVTQPETDFGGYYGSQVQQQSNDCSTIANQVHRDLSQTQISMPSATARDNLEVPNNQAHQLQSVFNGAGQGTPSVDVGKNQRYQSTLQFAASLLLQVQQQQQLQGVQGSGDQK